MRFGPRFSLRTLLTSLSILVVFSSWLVWQKRFVDARAEWLFKSGAWVNGVSRVEYAERPLAELPIPFVRRLLGDRLYVRIVMGRAHCSDKQLARLHELFPEAEVECDP